MEFNSTCHHFESVTVTETATLKKLPLPRDDLRQCVDLFVGERHEVVLAENRGSLVRPILITEELETNQPAYVNGTV